MKQTYIIILKSPKETDKKSFFCYLLPAPEGGRRFGNTKKLVFWYYVQLALPLRRFSNHRKTTYKDTVIFFNSKKIEVDS